MKTMLKLIAIILVICTLGGCVTTSVLTNGGDHKEQQINRQIGF